MGEERGVGREEGEQKGRKRERTTDQIFLFRKRGMILDSQGFTGLCLDSECY